MKNERFDVRLIVYECHVPGCAEEALFLCERTWDERGRRRSVSLKKCRKHALKWAEKHNV